MYFMPNNYAFNAFVALILFDFGTLSFKKVHILCYSFAFYLLYFTFTLKTWGIHTYILIYNYYESNHVSHTKIQSLTIYFSLLN